MKSSRMEDHRNSRFNFMFCMTIFKLKVLFISYVFGLNYVLIHVWLFK